MQTGKNWGSPEGETKFPYGVNLRGKIFARLLSRKTRLGWERFRFPASAGRQNRKIFVSLIEKNFRERVIKKC